MLVLLNTVFFVYQELRDCRPKTLVRDPVKRRAAHRFETPHQLVFALCAGVKFIKTLLDTKFDTLVKTGFEMQTGDVLQRAQ